MLWIVLLSFVTACGADHRYAFSCPPRLWVDYPDRSACRLTLSCGNSTASIQISTADGTDSITLQPGEPHIRVMDQKFPTDNGIENKGVIVTSDQELYCMVEQIDEYFTPPRHTDATQIHFVRDDSDQYSYYLASYNNPSASCSSTVHSQFYTIAAAEDSTQVEIYNRTELQQIVNLNQYQSYTYVTTDTANPGFDPTSTKVQSDKAISVISGALCQRNVADGAFITSIEPRVNTQFVAPHLGNTQDTGYTVKVIAHEGSTFVTINGEDSTVNEGDFVQLEFPGRTMVSVISCDPPCSAYMATKGYPHATDGTQASLLSIIPTAAMYTAVYFTTPDYDFPHFVSITAEGGGPYDDILLDGVTLAGQNWSVLGRFASTWFQIPQGLHWLESTSDRRLAVYNYGHSGYGGGGYAHSVWTDEVIIDTTITATEKTVTAETTTAIPARALPTYRIHTNGSAQTPDGSQISPLCAAGYVGTMTDNTKWMAAQVDGMIGATLCSQSPDMTILAGFSSIVFDQDKASVSMEFEMSVQQHHRQEDIDRCASEVALYVTDHAHWQQPILPGKDGCLDLVFVPEEFHHRGNFWYCPNQGEEPGELAKNSLLYSQKMYDILDTADGSTLSQVCVDKYVEEWGEQAAIMMGAINLAVQQGLCEEEATAVTSYFASVASLGTQAVVVADFIHTPSDVTFSEFFRCSDAALTFSLSRESWGQPFLPTPPGCPELVAEGDTLVLDQERWQCM